MTATQKQLDYLDALASKHNLADGLTALASVYNCSRSKAQKKHMTKADVSYAIDQMQAR